MQSYVTPFGYSSDSCGYCKDASTGSRRPDSRASYYLSSKRLALDTYQSLVDRGWRRSGTIFYKPDVLRHCCPHYTIRLPVDSFKPSRDQRQAVNKWNDHVLGEAYIKEASRLYPISRQEKARLKNTFDLDREIHKAEYANVRRSPEPAHRFDVTLEPAGFTLEKYELFYNYQQNVHKESDHQISQSGFRRFLCDSPLPQSSTHVNGKTQLLGSYHQCYRLDGRLIAMGVLDLLPHCVSGVYMLYHSDFEHWQFGKLSALREAALTLEGGYQYYYMGYYIHSCAKMKYKGDYKTQHVLDPETYAWNPLDDELRGLLDQKPYVSLARERRLQAGETPSLNADLAEYPHPTASEGGVAVSSGISLFDLKVPGLMTVEEIEQQVDLGAVAVQIRTRTVEAQDLVSWETGDLKDPRSLKGVIGELVACLGAEAAASVVVELG